MGNNIGEGTIQVNIYFHFERLIEKCYNQQNSADKANDLRRLSSIGLEDRLVDDLRLNSDLLNSTFDQIDQASR